MRKVLLLLVICMSLHACASQRSPYITTCDAPACSKTASPVELPYKAQEGLVVVTKPAVTFTAPSPVSKIAAQGSMLAIISEHGPRIGATTLTSHDIGLAEQGVSMKDFMAMVFLEPYSALINRKPDDETLHAVQSFKLSAFESALPRFFQRENLDLFYYRSGDFVQHKIYVVDGAKDDVVTMIDLYGFTQSQAEQLISSIQQHKP